ncbi:hypothetical protein AGABI2DRAFT_115693 [Agaricus bisporus var. bisporus H97]|uniref:hypothetical protein n=1 Tax=Agaricus bisporus var. bisporus (strain H97 / ATCC MYA-4626 / FGSC 10389) TaxID=936046 RepID=UPI00029F76C1|nr:hypothetical protein AGABI2DRAFT_115693 [Agaricus bisporus var. bisporus H97]EKV50618.1 hypothetical protein AGABI2DRAFT_115693 [Agaricus bisporus var. bisporus H97]
MRRPSVKLVATQFRSRNNWFRPCVTRNFLIPLDPPSSNPSSFNPTVLESASYDVQEIGLHLLPDDTPPILCVRGGVSAAKPLLRIHQRPNLCARDIPTTGGLGCRSLDVIIFSVVDSAYATSVEVHEVLDCHAGPWKYILRNEWQTSGGFDAVPPGLSPAPHTES